MPQPIDTSPPWWDGTIAIPFSVEEWKEIVGILDSHVRFQLDYVGDDIDVEMPLNIIDRIEKGIGVE
jgi:hypothetical protein